MNIHASGHHLKSAILSPVSRSEGLVIYRAEFTFEDENCMGDVHLDIECPMHGHLSTFTPLVFRESAMHQGFGCLNTRSEFFFNAPFVSAVRDGHVNHATVAVSDAVNTCRYTLSVRDFEEREEIRFTVDLPAAEAHPARTGQYELFIYIDERPRSMTDTMADLAAWFRQFYPARHPLMPAAEEPLYSSWYNFHQHPNAALLERELAIAAELGMRTLIIDDGWQFDGNGVGSYNDCGDWKISKGKFPDFGSFVRKTHELGFKTMLWFPVPFVGYNTQAYQTFKDFILYEPGGFGAGVLDVRYAHVRRHIIEIFAHFIRTYDLDGLKLDFIDSFAYHPSMPPANERMDVPCLSQAVIALLDEMDEALRAIKPDLLIEFRQNYVGPAVTRYCQMLRVGDCAFAADVNRVGAADLRLLDRPIAIHSDMLYWAHDETDENVARQLLSVLFCVPQISVLLSETAASHLDVIRAFLSYHTANRDVLLHGKLNFAGMDRGYPMVSSEKDGKIVTALYQPLVVHYRGGLHDIHNATDGTEIAVLNHTDHDCPVQIRSMTGVTLESQTIAPGVALLQIPVGGRAELGDMP